MDAFPPGVVTMAQSVLSRIQPFAKLKGKGRGQRVDTATGDKGKFEQERNTSEDHRPHLPSPAGERHVSHRIP